MLTQNFLQSIQDSTANYCFLLSSKILNLTSSDLPIFYNNLEYKTGLSQNSISVPVVANVKNNITIQIDSLISTLNCDSFLNQRVDISIFDITNQTKYILYKGIVSSFAKTNSSFIDVNITSILNKLSIQVGNLFSPMCRANLGDSQCKIDISKLKQTGKTTTIFNNASFQGDHQKQIVDYFKLGYVKFITGQNANLSFKIKNEINSVIFLLKPTTFPIMQNDEYELYPSCDKSVAMCKNRFKNIVNFQGEPFINLV